MHDLTRLLAEAELAAGPGSSVSVSIGDYGPGRTPAPYVSAYTNSGRPLRGEWGEPGIHVWCPYGSEHGTAVAVFTDDPHAAPEDLLSALIGFLSRSEFNEEFVL